MERLMRHVIVVGGGAAGMMAAVAAARAGSRCELFEQNEKLGKKIYITGKGRCNLTNACDPDDFLSHVCTNRKFLYSAFYGFTNQDAMRFFEESGLKIKTERGERVFPVSDHASDVIAALERQLHASGVQICLNSKVKEILLEPSGETAGEKGKSKEKEAPDGKKASEEKRAAGIRLSDGRCVFADAVIVCTGGLSYSSTGSAGDGFRFAAGAGHTVTACSPSLVPMETAEPYPAMLQGLSLRNVSIRILDGKKVLFEEFGEMMFTHYGVTGPLILTASTVVQKKLQEHPLSLLTDLKPALSLQQLDTRFLREFEANTNKQLKNVLGALYPAKLVPVMIERSGISPETPIHDISRQQRQRLVELTKAFPLTVTKLRGYNEAVITRGGVAVREIRPDSMESKLVRGLYFAGEVLDVDAVTGGFNLQIAWSTGHAAGSSAGI